MILLTLLIILSYIPVHPFMSDKNSAYEEYLWYQGVIGSIPLVNTYPVETESPVDSYDNLYSKFLMKKIDFENTLKNKIFYLDASAGISYSESILPLVSVSPKVELSLSDNMEAAVKVFLSNDINNGRGFKIKPFKDKIIAGFERGYLKYSNERFHVLFGRIDYHSSFSMNNSLLFDYKAPPTDGLTFSGNTGKIFAYDFKFLSLGSMRLDSTYTFEGEDIDMISRYLSFHKFTFSPKDYLRFSFSEACIFGRSKVGNILDYTYPFFVFYGEQNNIDINDNILWSFDVNYNFLGKANLSYSFLVDDYQYEYEGTKDLEPPELGHIISIDIPINCGIVSLNYLRVNAWVYNQRYPWNRYTYNEKNIGTDLGPDIQRFEGSFALPYSESGRIRAKTGYYQKGDNYSYSDWVFPIVDSYYYYTQIGIAPVSKWAEFAFDLEHMYKFVSLNVSMRYIRNIENTTNNLSVESYIRISI
ncbi:MAG: hypothetical protein PHW02_02300 [bacterium]|nr:hypothetical protein [bacterium]